jgi:hypothetical protein
MKARLMGCSLEPGPDGPSDATRALQSSLF